MVSMARMRWLWVPALVLLLAVGDASVYLYVAHAQRRKIDRQLNSVAINVVNAAATSASPTSDIDSIQCRTSIHLRRMGRISRF